MLLFVSMFALFTACHKDDDTDLLVGTWQLNEIRTPSMVVPIDDDSDILRVWEFRDDGVMVAHYSDDYTEQMSYKYLSDTQLLMGGEILFDILEVTKTKLTLYCEEVLFDMEGQDTLYFTRM